MQLSPQQKRNAQNLATAAGTLGLCVGGVYLLAPVGYAAKSFTSEDTASWKRLAVGAALTGTTFAVAGPAEGAAMLAAYSVCPPASRESMKDLREGLGQLRSMITGRRYES